MAERIEIKTVTVPAGTTTSSPLVTSLTWRQGYPVKVELRIPPGPSGLVGIQFAHSGQVLIPFDPTEWLVTDNEAVSWPLEGYPYNAKWTVRSYNSDIYDHTFQVRMLFNEVGSQGTERVSAPTFVEPWMSAGVGGEGV